MTDAEPGAIRVLIVDDHPVFAFGLASYLASIDGFDVVGRAGSEDDAVEATASLRPDVVLMDLDLGTGSGIEATRRIVRANPEVGVLIVTMLGDDDSVFASLRAGARGYILKGAAPTEVERAVRAVADGDVLLAADVARRAVALLSGARTAGPVVFPELTDREREVLDLVARGYDNSAIARRLVLSSKTIRNYLSGILSKLGVADRSALIVRARESGLGQDDTDGIPSGTAAAG
ncbi:response regulator transcription factor [Microbacterium cremeum]|uniref:response regulator transcription factor n=1 Tax=Microbacterium cremeum TaxID=2782169 RepID=UPI0018892B6B|nr:response regulator transcription factor [Microbacterium cremeum]